MPDDKVPVIECCKEGHEVISPGVYGPCMRTGAGFADYTVIHFCPFCGAELVFNNEGFWIVPRKGN